MEDKLSKAKEILKKYNQEHLFEFYNEITKDEKKILINQILNIDFEQIINLYNNSKIEEEREFSLSPLKYYDKEKISLEEKKQYVEIGSNIIKENKLAVITMAGGQGTRLGYNGPKGTFKLEQPINKSLFEIRCEELKDANKKYKSKILWCIMTSKENDQQTRSFFEDNNYFNYPKDRIKFFIQDTIPLIDIEGKVMLQELYKIREVSNGNGNIFLSLKKNKLIEKMKEENIQWISFGGIDNVLAKNIDPLFLGITIYNKKEIASKTIFKEQPLDKIAVFCKINNRPGILNYSDINLEISERKNEEGNYLYRDINILSHLMSFEAIEKCVDIDLPYHRNFKKNVFINSEGMKEVPQEPNSFKFENFIFDAFSFFDDMLLLRVKKEDEFAPIKDFTGPHNPEVAKDMYMNYWNNQLKEI